VSTSLVLVQIVGPCLRLESLSESLVQFLVCVFSPCPNCGSNSVSAPLVLARIFGSNLSFQSSVRVSCLGCLRRDFLRHCASYMRNRLCKAVGRSLSQAPWRETRRRAETPKNVYRIPYRIYSCSDRCKTPALLRLLIVLCIPVLSLSLSLPVQTIVSFLSCTRPCRSLPRLPVLENTFRIHDRILTLFLD